MAYFRIFHTEPAVGEAVADAWAPIFYSNQIVTIDGLLRIRLLHRNNCLALILRNSKLVN